MPKQADEQIENRGVNLGRRSPASGVTFPRRITLVSVDHAGNGPKTGKSPPSSPARSEAQPLEPFFFFFFFFFFTFLVFTAFPSPAVVSAKPQQISSPGLSERVRVSPASSTASPIHCVRPELRAHADLCIVRLKARKDRPVDKREHSTRFCASITGARSACFYGDLALPACAQVVRSEPKLMANPKHLKILRQGVTVWNDWRARERFISPNLRKANLEETNLHRANLREADLRGANLFKANVFEGDLRKANLAGACLHGANLAMADLREATLNGADLYDANLYHANLHGAHLHKTTLNGANLTGANLKEAALGGRTSIGRTLLARTSRGQPSWGRTSSEQS